MNETTLPKTKAPNFGTHQAWKSCFVMWVKRDGVYHVVRSAATMKTQFGPDVIAKVWCGGASGLCIQTTTWYDLKRRGRKFCRKCVAAMKAMSPK